MTGHRLETVPSTTTPYEIATILEREGCVIIERLWTEEFCDRALAEPIHG